MNDTKKRIERVKELSKKATPGPWFYGSWTVSNWDVGRMAQPERLIAHRVDAHTPDGITPEDRQLLTDDAAFIAEARELLPALALDCEALLGELGTSELVHLQQVLRYEEMQHQQAATERDKYRHQAVAYGDALTQQTIGLTDALGQAYSDPEQLYSMVRKLREERDWLREGLRLRGEAYKAACGVMVAGMNQERSERFNEADNRFLAWERKHGRLLDDKAGKE